MVFASVPGAHWEGIIWTHMQWQDCGGRVVIRATSLLEPLTLGVFGV